MMQWYKVEFAESLFSEHHAVQFLQDLNEQKEHHDIPSTPAVNPSLRNCKVISGSEWMSNLPKVIYHCEPTETMTYLWSLEIVYFKYLSDETIWN